MRRILSIALIVSTIFIMVLPVTGCGKKMKHYSSPEALVIDYINGVEIVPRETNVTVTANVHDYILDRTLVYFEYSSKIKHKISITLPPNDKLEIGESATLVITRVSTTNVGDYMIYAYIMK